MAGFRQSRLFRVFSAALALAWLAASPVRSILLYNAPILEEWKSDSCHAVEMEMEARLSEFVARAAAPHPKIRFVDFVRNHPPDLKSEHFADHYHLNMDGADLFSRLIAGLLVSEGMVEAIDSTLAGGSSTKTEIP